MFQYTPMRVYNEMITDLSTRHDDAELETTTFGCNNTERYGESVHQRAAQKLFHHRAINRSQPVSVHRKG